MLPIKCPRCSSNLDIDASKVWFYCGFCHRWFTRADFPDYKSVRSKVKLKRLLEKRDELKKQADDMKTKCERSGAPDILKDYERIMASLQDVNRKIALNPDYPRWENWCNEQKKLFEENFDWRVLPGGMELVITRYKGINRDIVVPSEYNGTPVTAIAENAFAGCSHLEKVSVSANIKKICDYAFFGCEKLRECVIVAEKLQLGTGIFGQCGIVTVKATENSTALEYAASHFCAYEVLYLQNKQNGKGARR